MEKKKILLICDMAGHSKVGMSAMLPIFSYLGYPTFNLPTALVSNTFNYGQFSLLDTTDYMRQTLDVWNSLGFTCDAICTGYLYSEEQAQLVADYCRTANHQGTHIFVDPVMGDGGHLYNGISTNQVAAMRHMIGLADICYPNFTEACMLTETPYSAEGYSWNDTKELLTRLLALDCQSALITSCKVEGQTAVAGYNQNSKEFFLLPYDELPDQFHGTGDIFAAVLTTQILAGQALETATQKAMDTISELIRRNLHQKDKLEGIAIENHLDLL